MKTTTIVTSLALVSVATATPTPPKGPDAALEKKDPGPDADTEDSFTHMLVERDGPYPPPGAAGPPPACAAQANIYYCPGICNPQ